MPKKLSTNPKAQEARERKETVKKEKKSAELKAAEDAVWSDEGQSSSERRAAEKERKLAEEKKKKEAKRLAQLKEEEEMKGVKTVKVNPHKVTLHTIQTSQAATLAAREAELVSEREEEDRKKQRLLLQPSLTENPNLVARKEEEEDKLRYLGGVVSASGLSNAVNALSINSSTLENEEKHPEKRMKAAYKDYEEKRFDLLKKENPTLKYSQLKDLLWKQFQKAPENPLNQAAIQAARERATQEANQRKKTRDDDDDDDNDDDNKSKGKG